MHYYDNYAITSTAISIYYSSICDSVITIAFITTILLYSISVLVAFMNIVVILPLYCDNNYYYYYNCALTNIADLNSTIIILK